MKKDIDYDKKIQEKADFFKNQVIPVMNQVRTYADECERLTAEDLWPYPTYSKLLFYV